MQTGKRLLEAQGSQNDKQQHDRTAKHRHENPDISDGGNFSHMLRSAGALDRQSDSNQQHCEISSNVELEIKHWTLHAPERSKCRHS